MPPKTRQRRSLGTITPGRSNNACRMANSLREKRTSPLRVRPAMRAGSNSNPFQQVVPLASPFARRVMARSRAPSSPRSKGFAR